MGLGGVRMVVYNNNDHREGKKTDVFFSSQISLLRGINIKPAPLAP